MRTARLISLSILASVAAAFTVAPGAQAADEYYLKIDGVVGESVAGAGVPAGAIRVSEFSWGAENTAAFGTGGTTVGRASFKEFTIKKTVDSTSPVLLQKLGQGASLPAIELAVRHVTATTPGPFYMRYCMQPAFLVSQDQAASGDASIEETLVFKFGAGSQRFARQNNTGAITTTVAGSWNTLTNAISMALTNGSNPCATSRF